MQFKNTIFEPSHDFEYSGNLTLSQGQFLAQNGRSILHFKLAALLINTKKHHNIDFIKHAPNKYTSKFILSNKTILFKTLCLNIDD
jgi:hypothetical protein